LGDIRTDVGGDAIISAGAVIDVGIAREITTVDLPEVSLDDGPVKRTVGTEPRVVSGSIIRDTINVRVGVADIGIGVDGGGEEL